MKKLLTVLLALSLVLGVFISCGGEEEPAQEEKTSVQETQAEPEDTESVEDEEAEKATESVEDEEAEEVAEEPEEEEEEEDPVEFRINNAAEPESLDPHLIQGVPEHRIYESLFEGLMAYDPETAEPVPGLAEDYDVSEDGRTYTFYLRETTWSDGVPITAQTVVDSWLRILDPETAAPYAWFPSMFIEGASEFNSGNADSDAVQIEAIDDYTFEVELVGPLPYVLGALPHYSFGVVPLHAIEEHGSEWTHPDNFVGNGPFVLEEWNPQQDLSVVPNDTYWDAEAVELDRVIYYPIDDSNTAYNMYNKEEKEIDWLTSVPTDKIEEAEMRDDYHASPQLATYYYVFNVEEAPFDDEYVRKAFSLAINREDLVEHITRSGQIPAKGIVPPMTGYEGLGDPEQDVREARRLLADAGYPNGVGFPETVVLYNTDESHKTIGETLQQQWSDNLNVEVELENQEWATYLSNRNEGNFQVARAGWVGDYQDPNTFLDMFITGAGMNGGNYSNNEYDELINKAARMDPGEERFQTLLEAEEILVEEDAAVMPLYYYVTLNMIDLDKWGGWHTNTMDYHPTKDIYLKD